MDNRLTQLLHHGLTRVHHISAGLEMVLCISTNLTGLGYFENLSLFKLPGLNNAFQIA